mmetsp:Transcript_86503/g.173079  ORF Transcript_86503/g.173079 Transcript_86503/m.173079 type:complete len:212 (+) Transcript_86503:2096-2731(+)
MRAACPAIPPLRGFPLRAASASWAAITRSSVAAKRLRQSTNVSTSRRSRAGAVSLWLQGGRSGMGRACHSYAFPSPPAPAESPYSPCSAPLSPPPTKVTLFFCTTVVESASSSNQPRRASNSRLVSLACIKNSSIEAISMTDFKFFASMSLAGPFRANALLNFFPSLPYLSTPFWAAMLAPFFRRTFFCNMVFASADLASPGLGAPRRPIF